MTRSVDTFHWVILAVAVCGTSFAEDGSAAADRQNIAATGETISLTRLKHKIPRRAVLFFQRGMKFAEAGDAHKAAVEFRDAIAVDPEFSEAHANLGVEYTALGELEQAVVSLRSATGIDPSTSRYHVNLAYTLYLLNELVEAESEAQRAVALDRTDPAARYMRGFLIAAHPEQREEAFEDLLYAARQIREARLVLATVYHLSGADARAGAQLQLFRNVAKAINAPH